MNSFLCKINLLSFLLLIRRILTLGLSYGGVVFTPLVDITSSISESSTQRIPLFGFGNPVVSLKSNYLLGFFSMISSIPGIC
jgi:hypothetical protein